ncbi:MAG: lipopolysaccharide kinase InaA family protein [Luteolibacter sp.]
MILYKYGSRSVVGGYALESGLQTALKYYFPRHVARSIGYGIRGSRCKQSWLAGFVFRQAGIPSPAPLVLKEISSLGGIGIARSFLATEKAEGISLADFVRKHEKDLPRLRNVSRQLEDAFSRMARYRIVHGDMKASNLLVNENSGDRISFIDLDASAFLLSDENWRKGFAKDQRRFLKNWEHSPVISNIFAGAFGPGGS